MLSDSGLVLEFAALSLKGGITGEQAVGPGPLGSLNWIWNSAFRRLVFYMISYCCFCFF